MSLHDVDKSSLDRGSPTPNHSDVLPDDSVKAHKTISTHYATDADTNTGRLQMQNKSILGNDGTVPRTLYGFNPALNSWGSFVTKAGVDVTTNTDLSQFIFNSNQGIFKIVGSGTANTPTITATPGGAGQWANATGSTAIPHGLAYIPIVVSALLYAGTYITLPFTSMGTNGTTSPNWTTVYTSADATNIYISIINQTLTTAFTNAIFPVKYYLLQETAN